MKTRSLLIAGLFAFGLTAQAQTVAYVIDGETATKPITELTEGSLDAATAITLTGEWDNSQLYGLFRALRMYGEENTNLQSADLSAITFKGDIGVTLFANCYELTSVVMPTAKIDNKVNLSFVFSNCEKLASPIDLSGFSNASGFNSTFYYCFLLPSVTMPSGTKVTDAISFRECFCSCFKLTSPIDLSGFGNISDFMNTFSSCTELTTIKMPAGSTAKSISLLNTFSECSKLTSPIDLSGFDISQFANTFGDCTAMPYVIMGKDLSAITEWTNAFDGVSSGFSIWIKATEAETNLGTMPEAYKPLVKYGDPTSIANSTVDAGFTLAGGKGNITITAGAAQSIRVVAVDGRTLRNINIEAGETKTIDGLAAGLYLVKGQKVVVR